MRNSPMKPVLAIANPIIRRRNGPIPVANNDQPRDRIAQPILQMRELERKNRNLIERVKELQAENDQLNWWIGKFADQQREAITAAGIQLRVAASRKPGIYTTCRY